jgi:hypothetical protein
MSVVVDELPAIAFKRKYPWETWADGRIHKLRRGEDFDATMRQFLRAAYGYSDRHDLTLTTRVRGDDVWVVFARYPQHATASSQRIG